MCLGKGRPAIASYRTIYSIYAYIESHPFGAGLDQPAETRRETVRVSEYLFCVYSASMIYDPVSSL